MGQLLELSTNFNTPSPRVLGGYLMIKLERVLERELLLLIDILSSVNFHQYIFYLDSAYHSPIRNIIRS